MPTAGIVTACGPSIYDSIQTSSERGQVLAPMTAPTSKSREPIAPARDRTAKPIDVIRSVGAATVLASLPAPIHFGDWVIRHREFALVRVEGESGNVGYSFSLTRDGPVGAIIRRSVAPKYIGRPVDEREALFEAALSSNVATLSTGVGFRALSLVDLAAWDLAAKSAGVSIARFLGGEVSSMPATAIIGYPPTIDGRAVTAQVEDLYRRGWRRFKLPISADHDLARERVRAAAAVADDIVLSMDAAWLFRDVSAAATFVRSLGVKLGWFEDVFRPGDAGIVADLRREIDTPIAMGDDQGGAYYPDALLDRQAVDIVRTDLTCMGGLTRLPRLLRTIDAAHAGFAPHMFAHIHAPVLSALGHRDVPIEWGVQGTGVDPYADSLPQPQIRDGRMEPLPEGPGFGTLVNPAWLAEQTVDDPDGVVRAVLTASPVSEPRRNQ
jgi:L-alanine-DL-glutamate epimerase-like enolase superfamily enzyme